MTPSGPGRPPGVPGAGPRRRGQKTANTCCDAELAGGVTPDELPRCSYALGPRAPRQERPRIPSEEKLCREAARLLRVDGVGPPPGQGRGHAALGAGRGHRSTVEFLKAHGRRRRPAVFPASTGFDGHHVPTKPLRARGADGHRRQRSRPSGHKRRARGPRPPRQEAAEPRAGWRGP